ncbi:EpsG family protein [Leuconostoc citreum]|uniref:EpsG family protein n=1 Tax=Leuconostoc citreum TaxID=33964 RepID=UPI00200B65B6|nr:EpsG family protein [Leuconostoc citreum]MCK8604570.1 EpsG family protein [Leuconostoc citreum]
MLTLVIILILLLVGVLVPKNSKISILGWSYLGWLSVTAPTEYLTSDYNAYRSAYFDPLSFQGVFEKGYTWLETIGYYFGLSFDQFRAVFAGIVVLSMYLAVSRFTKNHALFLSLYIMTFYSQDLIQMRSQFMMSLVLVAYSCLVGENHKKARLIIAVAIIMIAAQIHSSGYIFIIGILIYMGSKYIETIAKLSLIISVVLSLIISVVFKSSIFIYIINILGRLTDRVEVLNDKLLVLFTDGTAFSLKIWYFIPLLLAWVIIVSMIYRGNVDKLKFGDNQKYKVLLSGVLVGFLGYSLLSIAPDYSRIFRHGMVFFLILLSAYIERNKNIFSIRVHLSLIILMIPFVYFSFHSTSITWGPVAKQSPPYLLKIVQDK